MRGFPRLGAVLAQMLGEIFAQQRMRVERDEGAAGVAVDRNKLRVFEPLEGDIDLARFKRPVFALQTEELRFHRK